jgi:hypothetical protein
MHRVATNAIVSFSVVMIAPPIIRVLNHVLPARKRVIHDVNIAVASSDAVYRVHLALSRAK